MKLQLILISILLLFTSCTTSYEKVNDFESCIKAGFPAMESYPRQCRGPTGDTFTEILNQTENLETKFFCEDPRPELCTAEYDPVFGYFNGELIQCIKAPCGNTYSNGCVACSDEKVLYYIKNN